ncbi:MAG TPA: MOSC domain-containing protein [Acidimicrobiia bacterium]|jgi:MOSC domain-containing protein YiiM|nr:MOSC domain-containing protein [Acidimicrobiia bacterium]
MGRRGARLQRVVDLPHGAVVSVNVGRARAVDRNGEPATTAIWKSPLSGRVRARGVNLDGDEQADRSVHGGYDKAVYAYAVEDTRWWESELGRGIGPGGFGENLTVQGLHLVDSVVGERWAVGTAVLEVSEPRLPCWKLGVRMEDGSFPRRFTRAARPGTYLRIVDEGEIGAGDEVRIVSRPDHGFTVGDIWRVYHQDRRDAGALLDVPELGASWREWAEGRVQRMAES